MISLEPDKASILDRVEQSGCWRLIMQGKTNGFDTASQMITQDHIETHPTAYPASRIRRQLATLA